MIGEFDIVDCALIPSGLDRQVELHGSKAPAVTQL